MNILLYNYCTDKKRGDEMNSPKKRGRPKESNPRNKRFELRMTQEQEQLLVECSEKAGITKTEVIVKGIELFRDTL